MKFQIKSRTFESFNLRLRHNGPLEMNSYHNGPPYYQDEERPMETEEQVTEEEPVFALDLRIDKAAESISLFDDTNVLASSHVGPVFPEFARNRISEPYTLPLRKTSNSIENHVDIGSERPSQRQMQNSELRHYRHQQKLNQKRVQPQPIGNMPLLTPVHNPLLPIYDPWRTASTLNRPIPEAVVLRHRRTRLEAEAFDIYRNGTHSRSTTYSRLKYDHIEPTRSSHYLEQVPFPSGDCAIPGCLGCPPSRSPSRDFQRSRSRSPIYPPPARFDVPFRGSPVEPLVEVKEEPGLVYMQRSPPPLTSTREGGRFGQTSNGFFQHVLGKSSRENEPRSSFLHHVLQRQREYHRGDPLYPPVQSSRYTSATSTSTDAQYPSDDLREVDQRLRIGADNRRSTPENFRYRSPSPRREDFFLPQRGPMPRPDFRLPQPYVPHEVLEIDDKLRSIEHSVRLQTSYEVMHRRTSPEMDRRYDPLSRREMILVDSSRREMLPSPARRDMLPSPPCRDMLPSPPCRDMLPSPPRLDMLPSPPHRDMLQSANRRNMLSNPAQMGMLPSTPRNMPPSQGHRDILPSPPRRNLLNSPPDRGNMSRNRLPRRHEHDEDDAADVDRRLQSIEQDVMRHTEYRSRSPTPNRHNDGYDRQLLYRHQYSPRPNSRSPPRPNSILPLNLTIDYSAREADQHSISPVNNFIHNLSPPPAIPLNRNAEQFKKEEVILPPPEMSPSPGSPMSLPQLPPPLSPPLSASPSPPSTPHIKVEVTQEAGNSVQSSDKGKGRRGRPRKHAPKIPLPPLYVFIRNLLHNNSYNPSIVSWVNLEDGIFKVNHTIEFAKTWGKMKSHRSEEMNYEKMSRAMRYHYGSPNRKGHLAMVKEKRLVYRFGELAINWRSGDVEMKPCYLHDLCKGCLCLWTKE